MDIDNSLRRKIWKIKRTATKYENNKAFYDCLIKSNHTLDEFCMYLWEKEEEEFRKFIKEDLSLEEMLKIKT